jgi:hypothetical protein
MKHVAPRRLVRALATAVVAVALATSATGCNDNPADRAGVGAQCATNADCFETNQTCLTNFKGGYCGVTGCGADSDCPGGSACVLHTDQVKYCFRLCVDKAECNLHRSADNESNCVANVTFVDSTRTGVKACVPPSSGI